MGLLQDADLSSAGHLLDHYSVDSGAYAVRPAAVAFPRTARDASRIVKRAVSLGVPVTARGAGTGLVGGALGAGIILDMRRMDAVHMRGDSVHAGAGATRGALDRVLAGRSRMFGPDPSVGPYCTAGGMVATNAAGGRSLKYGCTIDNLLGVTMVDGTGRIVALPDDAELSDRIADICGRADLDSYPRTTKNSCGYRLDAARAASESHRVVAASEGTLGVIVSVRLRTVPAPLRRSLVVLRYRGGADAARDCPALAARGPSALEVVGPGVLGGGHAEWCYVFAEFEAAARDLVPPASASGEVVEVASGERALAWRRMRNSSLSLSQRAAGNRPSMVEDAAVPLDRLPDLFGCIDELGLALGARTYYYGHLGNGNIHLRVAADADGVAAERYLKRVADMGGTITAEHGDGMARTGLVKRQYGERNYALFAELKRLFDPHNIMNPGKVVECGCP